MGQAVRVSGVEQSGEQVAIVGARDVLQDEAAELAPKFPVMPGMSEDEGAGDDLAPRVALAFAMRRATRAELAAGFTLIFG
jgi:hypothetical protein